MNNSEASAPGINNSKAAALLGFLKAAATMRRKRIASYGADDKVLWFSDIPNNRLECRSQILGSPPEDPGAWLEVRKQPVPQRPPVPRIVDDWVRPDALDNPESEPQLSSEITVLVKHRVSNSSAPEGPSQTLEETVPEIRRLSDHREVEDAWLEYLVNRWEPWAKKTREWREVQKVFEVLDFMRRRVEEAEERYELILGIGYLEWRDPTQTSVARHILTAPAELTLDAGRGLITAAPGISFESFRIELDMLELQHRPRLESSTIREKLGSIDIQAWDLELIGPVLREIANTLRSDSQVAESLTCVGRAGDSPHLSFAPALVLRERRPTAYDELIGKFHEAATKGSLETTGPWNRIIDEGRGSTSHRSRPNTGPDSDAPPATVTQFLFPKPSNDEQRQIVARLAAQPCVLVKGPPGTGKSHTIANLISHLLAQGERVLVTAHAPKALAVLRDLLPDEIQHLCVTALGGSREEQEMLKAGIGSILARRDHASDDGAARRDIEKAEIALRDLQGEFARIERDLREFREAETHSHNLPGGYSGTAAQIAKAVSSREAELNWFPQLPADTKFPLQNSDVQTIADDHEFFTAERCSEVMMDIGTADLVRPEEFQSLVSTLAAARATMERASRGIDASKSDAVEMLGLEQQRGLRDALQMLTDLAVRTSRVLGNLTETILQDLLASVDARWLRLATESELLLDKAKHLLDATGSNQVELAGGISEDRLRADVLRRLAHFEGGGRKGFLVFVPSVVRDTRYIVEQCRVGGCQIIDLNQLRTLRDHLELRKFLQELSDAWGDVLPLIGSPKKTLTRAEELTKALKELLQFFSSKLAESLTTISGSHRTALASADSRVSWLSTIEAALAVRGTRDAEAALSDVLDAVRITPTIVPAHPCMQSLEEAVRTRDPAAWRAAWFAREEVRANKARLATRNALLQQLDEACPGLAQKIRGVSGDPTWLGKIRALREAWEWSSTRAWLQRISDAEKYKARVRDYHRVQARIETATEKLVGLRAWKAFFERLDLRTTQSLQAWAKTTDLIGKGTGVHAYRHRSSARKYLMDCLPRIPAWVMPLHKFWESVSPVPGMFDTVIIDEASQASGEALALLLLAKRIVVVGDNKQNSPEADFVPEDDIARLQKIHLADFYFSAQFRPDTSLFDHAARVFGSPVALREHFRCVPEIIRFSNALCYSDAPLIPLRHAPPGRLPPLQSRFVANGMCEGNGANIQNRAEAEAIVATICQLAEDEAYEGKTMGVIALQGHAQSRLIETLLVKKLDPRRLQELRLRCGEASTFQGDERDVMFLSLVMDPNKQKQMLQGLRWERVFNVAMSRARDQVWLFHSLQLHDLSHGDLRYSLVRFFESPHSAALEAVFEDLDKLERLAMGPRQFGAQPSPYESWFEVDVAIELMRRKYRIRPQVETAGRRIDLVVEGLESRIAVECDGDEWHGPDRYDDDMRRQRQLERVGWKFVRVRGSDFYANPHRAMSEVFAACVEYGVRPLDEFREAQVDDESSVCSGHDFVTPARDEDNAQTAQEARERVDLSVPSVGPFTGYSKEREFPDPREAPRTRVKDVLRQIIEQDGPLMRQSIYALYIKGSPHLERVGKAIRQALDKALSAMLRADELVQEDELGEASPENQVVRLAGTPAVRVRPAGARDLLEIPPSELLAIVQQDRRVAAVGTTADEEAFREVLEHYRFTKLTKARRDYLKRVFERFNKIGRGSVCQ